MPQTVFFFDSAAESAVAASAVALEEMKWRRFMVITAASANRE